MSVTSWPLDTVLDRLQGQGVERHGKGWTARCPAHHDRHPSLSIGVGDDGRVLVKCFAGCPTETIVAALGLTMADLYPASSNGPRPPAVTKYRILDADGVLHAIHRREDRADGTKGLSPKFGSN